MAIRILYDPSKAGSTPPEGYSAQQPSMQEQPQQQSSNPLSGILGSIGNVGLSALKGAGNLAAQVPDFFSAAMNKAPIVSSETGEITSPEELRAQGKSIQKETPYASDYVNKAIEAARKTLPKSIGFEGEGFINKVAEALPAFYTGSGFKEAISRAAGSEAGKFIASELGGKGQLAQFAGSVVGGAIASGLLSHGQIKRLQNQSYKDFENSIPEGSKTSLNDTSKEFKKILVPKKGENKDVSEWLTRYIAPFQGELKQAKGDTNKVFETMKKINEIKREKIGKLFGGDKRNVTESLNNLTNALKNDIAKTPKIDSEAFLRGHHLSWARANTNLLQKFLKLAKTKPAQLVAGAGTLGGAVQPLLAKAALGATGPYLAAGALGAKSLVEPAMLAAKNQDVRNLFKETIVPQTLAGILGSLKR